MIGLASLLLLASGGLGGPRWIMVEEIEINTFGEMPRTAILYRDAAGRIIDWRWDEADRRPVKLDFGRHIAIWKEGDQILHVEARRVTYSRTLHDVELAERVKWSEHKRRKLR